MRFSCVNRTYFFSLEHFDHLSEIA